jgi:hypothetical protein
MIPVSAFFDVEVGGLMGSEDVRRPRRQPASVSAVASAIANGR